MLKIILEKHGESELFCPRFICDACGRTIDDYRNALYFWTKDWNKVGDRVPMYLAHKGDCDRALEYKLSGTTYMSWGEMRNLPIFLAHSMGMEDLADIEKGIRDFHIG